VTNLPNGDTNKYSKYLKVTLAASVSDVQKATCSVTECVEFATNKVILTGADRGTFFVCGFGIMANIPSCTTSATLTN